MQPPLKPQATTSPHGIESPSSVANGNGERQEQSKAPETIPRPAPKAAQAPLSEIGVWIRPASALAMLSIPCGLV